MILCWRASADVAAPLRVVSAKVASPQTRTNSSASSTSHPDSRVDDRASGQESALGGSQQSGPCATTLSTVSGVASPAAWDRYRSIAPQPAAHRSHSDSSTRPSSFPRPYDPPPTWVPNLTRGQSRSRSGRGMAEQGAPFASRLSSRIGYESRTGSLTGSDHSSGSGWADGVRQSAPQNITASARQISGSGWADGVRQSAPQNTEGDAPHTKNRAQRRAADRTADISSRVVRNGPIRGSSLHSGELTARRKPRLDNLQSVDRSRGHPGVLTADEIRARILDAGRQGALFVTWSTP